MDPAQEAYDPRVEIKVSAESNPSSRTYKWVNTTTDNTLETSDTFTITESMHGQQSIKVIACNTVPVKPAKTLCKELNLNFTVPSKWITCLTPLVKTRLNNLSIMLYLYNLGKGVFM